MKSVYSTAPADRARNWWQIIFIFSLVKLRTLYLSNLKIDIGNRKFEHIYVYMYIQGISPSLSLSLYIYIYIYANFIKHNRHFMPTYFLLDLFEFPYYFYRIGGNWFRYCPYLYVSLVLSARLWAVIRGESITKVM